MVTVEVENYARSRAKLLQWAASFDNCVFLEDALTQRILVGIGAKKRFKSIEKLPQNQWLFGYVTYDYKNRLEDLVSENAETISFDCLHFLQPDMVVSLEKESFQVLYGEQTSLSVFETIQQLRVPTPVDTRCKVQATLTQQEYVDSVKALQKHIQRGDIYEVNFCQEFMAAHASLHPVSVYEQLLKASPMPFATFLREGEKYALCSSPERYIKKTSAKIISQPIKGTAKRGTTPEEDSKIIKALQNNPKERAENVMAVDVVRNDLARVAVPGSVEVDELCEVYTFKQLHQMISTVSADLPESATLADVLKASFPMASMTGAPKIRAMQLIEQYEKSKRGLYSGTIGYIAPNGDFDLNVVIRTILYDAKTQKLSFTVGSAITAEADAEKEYEECLLKATAMRKILSA